MTVLPTICEIMMIILVIQVSILSYQLLLFLFYNLLLLYALNFLTFRCTLSHIDVFISRVIVGGIPELLHEEIIQILIMLMFFCNFEILHNVYIPAICSKL